MPAGQYPIMLYGDELTCQTQGGNTANLVLATHNISTKKTNSSKIEAEAVLEKYLTLNRYI